MHGFSWGGVLRNKRKLHWEDFLLLFTLYSWVWKISFLITIIREISQSIFWFLIPPIHKSVLHFLSSTQKLCFDFAIAKWRKLYRKPCSFLIASRKCSIRIKNVKLGTRFFPDVIFLSTKGFEFEPLQMWNIPFEFKLAISITREVFWTQNIFKIIRMTYSEYIINNFAPQATISVLI